MTAVSARSPAGDEAPVFTAIPTHADLVSIVERSAFLHERRTSDFYVQHSDEQLRLADQRLRRWQELVAQGDIELFRQRLEWDGLTVDTVRHLFAGVRLTDPGSLPPWTRTLKTALFRNSRTTRLTLEQIEASARYLCGEQPIAFAHALIPFVDCVKDGIRRDCHRGWRMLTTAARSAILRHATQVLSSVAEDTLFLEFSVYVHAGAFYHDNSTDTQQLTSDPERRLYASFVRYLARGGMLHVCLRYPVLARMLAERTLAITSFVGEFLSRLDADYECLSRSLGDGTRLGQVQSLHAGLSDPHGHARSVIRVTFQNGVECLYKPRNSDSERAFHKVVSWLQGGGSGSEFHALRGVYRANHGWAQPVIQAPCATEDEVSRYFTRAGMLLALLYILEASDCHAHNLIAAGEYPVLIDTETLPQPVVSAAAMGETVDATVVANEALFSNSVFRVGMLPRYSTVQGTSCSLGALPASGPQPFVRRRIWHAVNTDMMSCGYEAHECELPPSAVLWNGQIMKSRDYAHEIVAGFRHVYRLVHARAADLLANNEIINGFRELSPRLLFRSTHLYKRVIDRCRHPQSLADGVDTTIESDIFCRHFLSSVTRPAIWPVLQLERRALLLGDIPRFTYQEETASVMEAHGPGAIVCDGISSGLARMRHHLQSLSEAELENETAYIRLALQCRSGADKHASDRLTEPEAPAIRTFTDVDLIEEAARLGRRIQETSFSASDGTCQWLTHAYTPETQRWQVQPMGVRLYDGCCGTGLFLSALTYAGLEGFKDCAVGAFRSVTSSNQHRLRRTTPYGEDLGAGTGIGSVIYGLTRGGMFLGEPALVSAALSEAAAITRDRVLSDRFFDVVCGCAGLALSLLTLYQLRPEEWIMDRVGWCADHLIASREPGVKGGAAWRTLQGTALCGFAHGAAGIAYTLRRVWAATQEKKYALAALEADLWEDSWFSSADRNWADLAQPAGTLFSVPPRNAWCHGAVGILLGRSSLASQQTQKPEEPYATALASVASMPLTPLDHACCGNTGRIELLYEIERHRNGTLMPGTARALASRMVTRATNQGGYRLGLPKRFEAPSFHQGLSGIGYQLLRLVRPDLPSVLLWE